MDQIYKLTLTNGVEATYQCETLQVTDTTVTGINAARVVVFVVPVSQISVLQKIS